PASASPIRRIWPTCSSGLSEDRRAPTAAPCAETRAYRAGPCPGREQLAHPDRESAALDTGSGVSTGEVRRYSQRGSRPSRRPVSRSRISTDHHEQLARDHLG